MNMTFFRSLGVYICIPLYMHNDNNNVWVCAHMHMIFQTKRKTGIADEAARLALNQLNRNSASPPPKKGGKEKEAEKKDAKKGVRFVPVLVLLLMCVTFSWALSSQHFAFVLHQDMAALILSVYFWVWSH